MDSAFLALTRSAVAICALNISCLPACAESKVTADPRSRQSLDFDWRFQLGDVEKAKPAFEPTLDDHAWRVVDVPHDWSIEGEYREDHPAGIAGAFLPAGVGWYRKHLQWLPEWEGKRLLLEFDGVYMNSEVWVNGHRVGRRPYGYVSFWYDVTKYLKSGNNVIAVRVDNSRVPSGRWYTGSGIYRHVWLTAVDPVHVPVWGVSVRTPKVSKKAATVSVTVEVENQSAEEQDAQVNVALVAPSGEEVAMASVTRQVGTDAVTPVELQVDVKNPQLWSPAQPNLYQVVSTIRTKDIVRDRIVTTAGIRSLDISVDRGFLLNGSPLELRGACMHHDAGPVGAAVPNDVLRHRLKLLKQMGANAIRTSHNPFAPEFYDMADQIGLMVMNEAFDGWAKPKAKHDYGNYFKDWWQRDLTDFIRRDRNHPCVVIWSIGNEVRGWKPADQKRIVQFVKSLDPTRPVTQGEGARGGHLDIAGFNGHGEYRGDIESFHRRNPNTPIIGTEITHTSQTRGVYRTKTSYRTRDNPAPWERIGPGARKKWEQIKSRIHFVDDFTSEEVFPNVSVKYQSSYDNSFVRMNVREEIRLANRLPYLLGTFRWTAFDYLGESFGWPARTANFGVIDLAGFPKDHYFLYQSQWSDRPMVHLLPHWTHPGKEAVEIPVVVYTNARSAELFLNGQSLGEKQNGEEMQIVWMVPYEPGTLEVMAQADGGEKLHKSVSTARGPHRVQLTLDREEAIANRQDVIRAVATVVDQSGEPVPDANHIVQFAIAGPAKLIGVENGDILDLAPHKVSHRKAFKGKCLALIQTTGDAGTISITASSNGIEESTATVASIAE